VSCLGEKERVVLISDACTLPIYSLEGIHFQYDKMGTEEAPCGLNSFWPPHRPEIGRESPVEEEEEETVVWLW
jgi:hypothetical protein